MKEKTKKEKQGLPACLSWPVRGKTS